MIASLLAVASMLLRVFLRVVLALQTINRLHKGRQRRHLMRGAARAAATLLLRRRQLSTAL